VEKALSRLIAEVEGNQDQDQYPHDVGKHGDRHDAGQQRGRAQAISVAGQIGIEAAERPEAVERVQARAGIGHEQLVLPDAQHDTVAGDRIVPPVEDRFNRMRHGVLQRTRHGLDDEAGQRDKENQEEQRKPGASQRRPAKQHEADAGEHRDMRSDLEQRDALRTTHHIEQQPQREHQAAGHRRGARAGLQEKSAVAPEQPGDDHQDERTVRIGLFGPQASGELEVTRHVHRREADHDGEPQT
jgi:hypothetical protein